MNHQAKNKEEKFLGQNVTISILGQLNQNELHNSTHRTNALKSHPQSFKNKP